MWVDIASKFLEHFLFIADALSFDSKTGDRISLWHKNDSFYYDAINWGGSCKEALPVKSLVGLIPLFAVFILEPGTLDRFPGFKRRFEWFLEERKGLSTRIIGSTATSTTGESGLSASANGSSSSPSDAVANGGIHPLKGSKNGLTRHLEVAGKQRTEREIATENLRKEHPKHRRLFALVDDDRLRKILGHMLSETQFLSTYGIRSCLSSFSFELMIGCPRSILLHLRVNRMCTPSMVRNSKSSIGLRIRRVGCLVATAIGADPSGLVIPVNSPYLTL